MAEAKPQSVLTGFILHQRRHMVESTSGEYGVALKLQDVTFIKKNSAFHIFMKTVTTVSYETVEL